MEVDPRHPNSWIALAVAQILNRQPYLEALQRVYLCYPPHPPLPAPSLTQRPC